ncbi:MAG: fused response regulator/phosphatase [Spirochaetia bacterium]|jgi:serine phosphatase RsbU (regulator of sigma subunit)|nr:fused response regulator/phosphatase [Spirochaetia bacterium]
MMEQRTILFVDDEQDILSSIRRSLTKWLKTENLKIEIAASVHNALEIIRDNSEEIAVLVSDQRMPDLRGSELSNIVAKKYPDIVIIILSGHSDMGDISDIIRADVFSFLEKPWEINILQHEIIKALRVHLLRRDNRIIREKQAEELRLGMEFQKSILRVPLPSSTNITFNVTYKPSSETGVGGDYYDIIEQDPKHFIVLMGDVSGHGINTAFLTAVLKSIIYPGYIQNLHFQTFVPSRFLCWLNSRICRFLEKFPELFITFSAALIDLDDNKLILANAGQPPVFKVTGNGISKIEAPLGLVLGVDKDYVYKEKQFNIEQGEGLFFCSDGIYPSGNASAGFNIEGFKKVLKGNSSDIHDHKHIIKEMEDLTLHEVWDDDITIVTVVIS